MLKIILKCPIYNRAASSLGKASAATIPLKHTSSGSEKKVQVDDEHLFGKKHTIRKLQQLLCVSTFIAQGIANTNKTLSLVNGKIMTNLYEKLKAAGVSKDTVLRYPTLLATKDLDANLVICKKLSVDLNDVAPLLTLNTRELASMLTRGVTEHRINVLSDLLQVNIFL